MKAHCSALLLPIVLVVVLALVLAPLAGAQEGPTPEAIGLRPDAPSYALHGPYWVGTMEIEAKTDFHETTVTMWYPTLNAHEETENVEYTQYWRVTGRTEPMMGHAIRGTPFDFSGSPYPLVIFAHGGNTVRFMSSWLCEHVASYGFVVMAIDYADSWRFDPSSDGRLQAMTRPLDVRWEIDFAEQLTSAGGEMEGMINTEHVAIMGHSYGGYTAYAAAGARMASFDSPTGWCSLYSDLPVPVEAGPVSRCLSPDQVRRFEERYVRDAGLSVVPDGLWPALGDARVDAIVTLAPSVAEFDADGTREVKMPVLVITGSKDRWVLSDNPLFRQYAYENLASTQKALAVLEYADHMIFHNTCREMPLAIELGVFFACSDPVWDMDRAHDLINHFSTAFLLATLKNDADAAAVLAPDAVSFPGITYEAQGF